MKKIKGLKGISFLLLGLICLIFTLLINELVNNDIICLIFMIGFFLIELYGLIQIIKEKYQNE